MPKTLRFADIQFYSNASLICRRLQQYERAYEYATKAYDLMQQNPQAMLQGGSRVSYTTYKISLLMGKKNEARFYAQKSLDYARTKVDSMLAFLALGKTYFDNGQYNQSIEMHKHILPLSRAMKMDDLAYNAYSKMAEAHFKLKNHKEAYKYGIEAAIYKDKITEQRNAKAVDKLKIQYETEKKEQEIIKLSQQNQIYELENQKAQALQQKQKYALGMALTAPLLLLVGGGWYVNRNKLQTALELEQKERDKQMSELKALRSQMNPHFIFNALNSIQDFILLNEADLAQDYLSEFATLMRGFLDSSGKEEVSLEQEIPLLKSYVKLEGLRLGSGFSYRFQVDKNINLSSTKVPPLLIQPYIENAFKHGLPYIKGEKKLLVDFSTNDRQNLVITIRDNGVGRRRSAEINARKQKRYESFAQKASDRRMNLMSKQARNKISVTIQDFTNPNGEVAGTIVKMVIIEPSQY